MMLGKKRVSGQLYSRSSCSDASIHHKMGPGDMACLVGGEKQRCIGEIPAPGPPCKKSIGTPMGLPTSSQ